MNKLGKLSGLQKDYLIADMQAKVNTLQDVLFSLRHTMYLKKDYANESLKELERTVRVMQKINSAN